MPSSLCDAVNLAEGLRISGNAGQDSSNLFDLHPYCGMIHMQNKEQY